MTGGDLENKCCLHSLAGLQARQDSRRTVGLSAKLKQSRKPCRWSFCSVCALCTVPAFSFVPPSTSWLSFQSRWSVIGPFQRDVQREDAPAAGAPSLSNRERRIWIVLPEQPGRRWRHGRRTTVPRLVPAVRAQLVRNLLGLVSQAQDPLLGGRAPICRGK